MRIALTGLAAAVVLAGCGGIEQRIIPVTKLELKQICVIENSRVRQAFLDAMQVALEKKGFQVQRLPETAQPSACPLTLRYTANWRWDLALYLAYAELKVYQDEKERGFAIYNAMRATASPRKFINAEEKVNELVNQLFPER